MTLSVKTSSSRAACFSAALVGLFVLVTLSGVLTHEMWRDELHAWMLARDSHSLAQLFSNLRTEGHPGLWHLSLYALSRISRDPLLMQVFHLGIAAASVYLIARFSPFSLLQKCLLAFGYFNIYEYAIISRSYAMGVFLIFAFCACMTRLEAPKTRTTPYTQFAPFLILALTANTSVYGLFISMALMLYLVSPTSPTHKSSYPYVRISGILFVVSAWLICLLQVSQITRGQGAQRYAFTDLSTPLGGVELLAVIMRAATTLTQIWRSYVPMPALWSDNFWGTNVLEAVDVFQLVAGIDVTEVFTVLMSVLFVVCVCFFLKHQPKLLATYLTGTLLLLGFSFVFFEGSIRHHGHLFILLVACLWLSRAGFNRVVSAAPESHRSLPNIDTDLVKNDNRQQIFLTTLLIFHVCAGALLVSVDWMKPFSGSRRAADYILDHQLEDFPIFGYLDREVSSISAYLDKPVFYPDANGFGTFWTTPFNRDWTGITDAIQIFVQEQGEPTILILTKPLELQIPGVDIELLTRSPGKLAPEETFYLYRADSR